MKVIERTIDIAAPPHVVWRILTDVDDYATWNPFLTIEPAPTALGRRLRITVQTGRRSMTFRPIVTAYDPGHEIAWLGRFLAPRVADGRHTLIVEALPDGTTRFRQREEFRGVLVPVLGSMVRNTSAGFDAMNSALAAHATTLFRRTPPQGCSA